jgi:hypothetical protein
MHATRTLPVLFFALWLAPAVLLAGLRMPDIFSDHLVSQRDRPVPVWGWADVGVEITVSFAGQTKTAVADKSGRWLATLNAMEANCEPQTMTVAWSNGGRTAIHDVFVGDVWLCSGQSNMTMTVDGRTAWLYIGGGGQWKVDWGIGIFGEYASLTLITPSTLSDKRILAQDLAGNTPVDITSDVQALAHPGLGTRGHVGQS